MYSFFGNIPEKRGDFRVIPPVMESFRLSDVHPEGWLKEQVRLSTSGFFGHLTDISKFLGPHNGWLNPEMTIEEYRRKSGDNDPDYRSVAWEEQAYWLRGAYKLALITNDRNLSEITEKYISAILGSAQPDGYFGPVCLKDTDPDMPGLPDIWPHMIIADVLRDYYEATSDRRAVDILLGFCRYCLSIPDDRFILEDEKYRLWYGMIQTARACDMVPVINWLYGLTGEEYLIGLSHRFYERFTKYPRQQYDRHVVNFAMRIRYHASDYPVSHDPDRLDMSEHRYLAHMDKWGQMPGGLYAADENTREGKHDPRQGTETCAMSEITKSFGYLGALTGDPLYSDRIEDIMFNSYPASHTPDYSALHYITADNQPFLDAETHDYDNGGMQSRYSAFSYRCCQHNTGMGWPNFISAMYSKAGEDDIAVNIYSPSVLDTKDKDKRTRIIQSTDYPFRTSVKITVQTEKDSLGIYLRVPGWAVSTRITSGSGVYESGKKPGYVYVSNVHDGDVIEIRFGQVTEKRRYPQNRCVAVYRGPLAYSLRISEKWTEADTHTDRAGRSWSDYDVSADSPFSYALRLKDEIHVKEEREVPAQPFTSGSAPVVLTTNGIPLENWGIGDDNTIKPVPVLKDEEFSGARSDQIELVPLGCMRSRISCFPYID